jgi:hypothetical protein
MKDFKLAQESLESMEAEALEKYFDGKIKEFLEMAEHQLSNPQLDNLIRQLEVIVYERQSVDLYADDLPF